MGSITATATVMAGIGFMLQYIPLLSIATIILKMGGLSTFRVRKDRDRVKGLLKVLDAETRSSSTIFEYGKARPGGTFFGWGCFGYYSDGTGRDDDGEIMIFTTESRFKKMIEKSSTDCSSVTFEHTLSNAHSQGEIPKSRKEVLIWGRRGSYESLYYSSLKVDVSMISPMGDQNYIVEDIIDKYRARERLVVFIHGVTGAGKSSIGLLLAKELRGNYCNKFNPIEPGDNFQSLLRDVDIDEADERPPFIVVIEEIDTVIEAVHRGEVPAHKKVTTMIRNKSSYNTFFDDMIIYSKVIFVLTSNRSKEEIDKLDPCYLRQGRVNAYYKMMKPLAI